MNYGLTDYEKLKVIRPLLGNHTCDEQRMPVMHKVTEDMLDLEHAQALNIQNLNAKHNNSDKIVLPFNYDKVMLRYWNDPLKYIPILQTAMAVGTPDYSAYPTMNPHEIAHNIYQNRWLGCLWQAYGCTAIPTIAWALPDTYDVCFSGVENGSIVIISTVGCNDYQKEFMQGYEEMIARLNPPLIIVYGDMLPEMYGRFLHFKYTDAFNKKDCQYVQQTLFDISPIFERKRGALKHLSFYDDNHNQAVSIDLMHSHHGLIPHKHLNLDHSDKGIPITEKEQAMVNKIRRRYNLK